MFFFYIFVLDFFVYNCVDECFDVGDLYWISVFFIIDLGLLILYVF